MNSFNQTLKIFILLFGILVVGVFLGLTLKNIGYAPVAQNNQASVASSFEDKGKVVVDLLIDYGNGDTQSFPQQSLSQGDSVFDLLTTLEEKGILIEVRNFPGLGKFVEAIYGVHNSNNFYWQFWVNDDYAKVGAELYVLEDGDSVLWKRTDQNEEL